MNAGRIVREAGYDTDALRLRIAPVNPDRINVWPASKLLMSLWRPGIEGQTQGKMIFVDPKVMKGDRRRLARLVIHELVHVRQCATAGYLRFTASYLTEYLMGRLDGKSPRQSYLAISHEREARELTARTVAIT